MNFEQVFDETRSVVVESDKISKDKLLEVKNNVLLELPSIVKVSVIFGIGQNDYLFKSRVIREAEH